MTNTNFVLIILFLFLFASCCEEDCPVGSSRFLIGPPIKTVPIPDIDDTPPDISFTFYEVEDCCYFKADLYEEITADGCGILIPSEYTGIGKAYKLEITVSDSEGLDSIRIKYFPTAQITIDTSDNNRKIYKDKEKDHISYFSLKLVEGNITKTGATIFPELEMLPPRPKINFTNLFIEAYPSAKKINFSDSGSSCSTPSVNTNTGKTSKVVTWHSG